MQLIGKIEKSMLLTDATTKTGKQDLAQLSDFLEHRQASGLI